LPTHMYPAAHCRVPFPAQVPEPLHVEWFVCVVPLHDCATHSVPFTHLRHAPAPSHIPSRPHVACAVAPQPLVAGNPAVIGRHVPAVPPFFAARHEWQPSELHALLQQTPSGEQTPLWHSSVDPHATPAAFFVWHA